MQTATAGITRVAWVARSAGIRRERVEARVGRRPRPDDLDPGGRLSRRDEHTQQALAAHDAQIQQQIKEMTARGEPLAPLAAATSSPETAQLIALQSLVLAGQVDVMEAARMNVAATGGETTLLDHISRRSTSARPLVALGPTPRGSADEGAVEDDEDGAVEGVPIPSGRYNAKWITARLEATR